MLVGLNIVFSSSKVDAQETNWGVEFSDAIMKRHPGTINDLTGKGWEYSNSIVLFGMQKLYKYTKNPAYLKYIKKYVDVYVRANGTISFDSSANNLDHLHPGLMCLFLYEHTGEEKYRIAAEKIRQEFDKQPRNASGGYWHKQRYTNQMWADGIYMAEPFLVEYGKMFDDEAYTIEEAAKQTLLLAEHAYDTTLNLIYHGWDETLSASWADANGRSPIVWSRGMGWYCMALVDMLDYIPESHAAHSEFVELVKGLAKGIKKYQDETTGLWFQVVDKGHISTNWIEASGSAMFIYMLKKGVDQGYIDTTYNEVIDKGWAGMQTKITLDRYKQPVINGFVLGMGIKDSYASYISQSRVSTPSSRYSHGYCGILSLASVMEWPKANINKLDIEISGEGDVVTGETDSVFMPGRYVCLKARSKNGSTFEGWTGDVESTDTLIYVRMDSAINVVASFLSQSTLDVNLPNEGLSIYPNPVEDVLYLNGLELKGDLDYTILSLNGVVVDNGSVNSSQINTNDIASGYYVLEIMNQQLSFIKRE